MFECRNHIDALEGSMSARRMKRGFTLAELLIVVAIIAVLVAVSIPVFTKQLERSRESVDFANMRSAYAAVMVAALSDDAGLKQADGTFKSEFALKQKQEDWQTSGVKNMRIGNVPYDDWDSKMPAIGGTASATFDPKTEKVIIDWGGSGSNPGGGTGNTSAIHATVINSPEDFDRGTVIQDETGTCVILSRDNDVWNAYLNGAKAQDFVNQFNANQVAMVANPSVVKDISSDTLQTGDLCYDPATGTYYYIRAFNQYDTRPGGQWDPLKQ